MARRLTLVAGAGDLVPYLAASARQHGDILQVLDLASRADIAGDEFVAASLSDATSLIARIKAFRPTHILLAGAVHISDKDREGLARAFGLAGRLAGGLGDVGLAGMILLYCQMHRIKLVGAHEVAPELLAPEGRIAGPAMDDTMRLSANLAMKAAKAVGAIDLGQSVVVSGSRPIAAEDAGGTDALLERVAQLRQQGLIADGAGPLVLAKARKPKQPKFVDLPAVGPLTIVNAAKAGVGVVVVEAGATLLLDRVALEREAVARRISVIGVRHG